MAPYSKEQEDEMSPTKQITMAIGLSVAIVGVAASLTAGPSTKVVQVRDDCDPATFNADPPDGPGLGHICDGNGGTTFGDFIDELTATQVARKWRFNPDEVSQPRNLIAHNRGGETHTFTPVAEFGGGIVPLLNDLSGTPVVAPECADQATFNATAIPAGGDSNEFVLRRGQTAKFQCCIHPWMRTTVRGR